MYYRCLRVKKLCIFRQIIVLFLVKYITLSNLLWNVECNKMFRMMGYDGSGTFFLEIVNLITSSNYVGIYLRAVNFPLMTDSIPWNFIKSRACNNSRLLILFTLQPHMSANVAVISIINPSKLFARSHISHTSFLKHISCYSHE